MFRDALHGWLATVEPGRPGEESYNSPSRITVFRTLDGGSNWESTVFEGPPDGDPGPPSVSPRYFDFLDERKGWLAAESRGGLQAAGLVFATIDGGATWRQRSSWIEGGAGPIHFVDEARGWMANPVVGLLATDDGGASWEHEALPLPEGYVHAGLPLLPPRFVAGAQGVAPVALVATNEPSVTAFYVTADGGNSWQLAATTTVPSWMVSIVNLDVWIAAGDELNVTLDRGNSWKQVRADWKSPGRLVRLPGQPTSIYPSEITFITERDGWAILGVTRGSDGVNALIQTDDGGRTWKLIGPY
jgi:photosystem II stability/assembly factor-like uncharacterized protein